ncbi:nucleophile aminohydrolase [Tribonema minus]|uniref:Nucleophile aminohydrolase n=1 Tax=Tribonema minus TaxID=303371 RepID=A0A836CIT8_9STRA|nr:nucleophile aminohydrolase [Tribonema minus]
MPQNADGTGVVWYDEEREAHRYTSTAPAWADPGLQDLSSSTKSSLFFGHVRSASANVLGESAAPVGDFNVHPFVHENISFMHNGAVSGFAGVRPLLEAQVNEAVAPAIQGTTDSELLFSIYLTQLDAISSKSSGGSSSNSGSSSGGSGSGRYTAPQLAAALDRTIGVVTATTVAAGVPHASSLNLAVSDGASVVVSRYRNALAASEQPPSLYMTHGSGLRVGGGGCLHWARPGDGGGNGGGGSVVVASEPLCENNLSSWSLVPKNTMVVVEADPLRNDRVGRLWLRPVYHGVNADEVRQRGERWARVQQRSAWASSDAAAAAAAATAPRAGLCSAAVLAQLASNAPPSPLTATLRA